MGLAAGQARLLVLLFDDDERSTKFIESETHGEREEVLEKVGDEDETVSTVVCRVHNRAS